jgi:hypothetical protein
MTTIAELIQELKTNAANLEKALLELDQPFAGMIDVEAVDQVEQERNLDHANDNGI